MKKGLFAPRYIAIVAVFATAPGLAYAYIDPGSGAYMVQALFTLVGAALFYIRHPIRTARELGRKIFRRSSSQDQASVQDADSDLLEVRSNGAEGLKAPARRDSQA